VDAEGNCGLPGQHVLSRLLGSDAAGFPSVKKRPAKKFLKNDCWIIGFDPGGSLGENNVLVEHCLEFFVSCQKNFNIQEDDTGQGSDTNQEKKLHWPIKSRDHAIWSNAPDWLVLE